MVAPEADGFQEVLMHVRVVPIPIGLLFGEQVQVPLAIRHPGPGWPAEGGRPLGRRQLAVFAPPIPEDVTVPLRGAGAGRQGRLKPRVMVGGMVGNYVHHDLEPPAVGGLHHGVEIVHGSQPGIDRPVIVHIITAIGQLRRVERGEPEGVDPQLLQIIHMLGDAGQVPQSIAVFVRKGSGIDLVDDGLLPPVVGVRIVDDGWAVGFHRAVGGRGGRIVCHGLPPLKIFFPARSSALGPGLLRRELLPVVTIRCKSLQGIAIVANHCESLRVSANDCKRL